MAITWTLGTTEDGLVIQVTAVQNGADVDFTVEVLEGSAHINALYWSDGDDAGGESSYSGFTNTDGTLVRSEHSVNMNGTGVVWDGGHLISLPGLRGNEPQGVGDDPISFTLEGVTIADFETLGVRATSTSTEEGSIKWFALGEEVEVVPEEESGEQEEQPLQEEAEAQLTFFPTQGGNSLNHVGFFSVTSSEETFSFESSAVDSLNEPVPDAGIAVDSESGNLSFGNGINAVDPGTYKVTVTATGSEGAIVTSTFTVLLGDKAGNPGNAAPDGSADTMPEVLYVLDDTGLNILLGMNGNDSLAGSDGVDYILGGNHDDTIDAGAGNDVIWGGNGADGITGGAGDDLFAFLQAGESAPGKSDTILDWADGADRIHLALIDANPANAGDDAFAWGGENSDVVANSITWHYDGETDTTIVQGDTDGDDATAEIQIVLLGNHILADSDFVL